MPVALLRLAPLLIVALVAFALVGQDGRVGAGLAFLEEARSIVLEVYKALVGRVDLLQRLAVVFFVWFLQRESFLGRYLPGVRLPDHTTGLGETRRRGGLLAGARYYVLHRHLRCLVVSSPLLLLLAH